MPGAIEVDPSVVAGIPGGVRQVQAGRFLDFIVSNTGSLYHFEWANYDLASRSATPPTSYASFLVPITGAVGVDRVAYVGQDKVVVLKNDGTLWWLEGRTLVAFAGPDGQPASRVSSIASSGSDVIASLFVLLQDGTVWGWGDNSFGQLGDGTGVRAPMPVRIPLN